MRGETYPATLKIQGHSHKSKNGRKPDTFTAGLENIILTCWTKRINMHAFKCGRSCNRDGAGWYDGK